MLLLTNFYFSRWLVSLEETCWLSHISSIIKAALVIVKAVHDDWRPVLVHCSDGWDRTSQLASLSQLLLDPYYRTMEVGTPCNLH